MLCLVGKGAAFGSVALLHLAAKQIEGRECVSIRFSMSSAPSLLIFGGHRDMFKENQQGRRVDRSLEDGLCPQLGCLVRVLGPH